MLRIFTLLSLAWASPSSSESLDYLNKRDGDGPFTIGTYTGTGPHSIVQPTETVVPCLSGDSSGQGFAFKAYEVNLDQIDERLVNNPAGDLNLLGGKVAEGTSLGEFTDIQIYSLVASTEIVAFELTGYFVPPSDGVYTFGLISTGHATVQLGSEGSCIDRFSVTDYASLDVGYPLNAWSSNPEVRASEIYVNLKAGYTYPTRVVVFMDTSDVKSDFVITGPNGENIDFSHVAQLNIKEDIEIPSTMPTVTVTQSTFKGETLTTDGLYTIGSVTTSGKFVEVVKPTSTFTSCPVGKYGGAGFDLKMYNVDNVGTLYYDNGTVNFDSLGTPFADSIGVMDIDDMYVYASLNSGGLVAAELVGYFVPPTDGKYKFSFNSEIFGSLQVGGGTNCLGDFRTESVTNTGYLFVNQDEPQADVSHNLNSVSSYPIRLVLVFNPENSKASFAITSPSNKELDYSYVHEMDLSDRPTTVSLPTVSSVYTGNIPTTFTESGVVVVAEPTFVAQSCPDTQVTGNGFSFSMYSSQEASIDMLEGEPFSSGREIIDMDDIFLFASLSSDPYIGVELTGFLSIQEPGDYSFTLFSDQYSSLQLGKGVYCDGNITSQTINNQTAMHGIQKRDDSSAGSVTSYQLQEGEYPIRVVFIFTPESTTPNIVMQSSSGRLDFNNIDQLYYPPPPVVSSSSVSSSSISLTPSSSSSSASHFSSISQSFSVSSDTTQSQSHSNTTSVSPSQTSSASISQESSGSDVSSSEPTVSSSITTSVSSDLPTITLKETGSPTTYTTDGAYVVGSATYSGMHIVVVENNAYYTLTTVIPGAVPTTFTTNGFFTQGSVVSGDYVIVVKPTAYFNSSSSSTASYSSDISTSIGDLNTITSTGGNPTTYTTDGPYMVGTSPTNGPHVVVIYPGNNGDNVYSSASAVQTESSIAENPDQTVTEVKTYTDTECSSSVPTPETTTKTTYTTTVTRCGTVHHGSTIITTTRTLTATICPEEAHHTKNPANDRTYSDQNGAVSPTLVALQSTNTPNGGPGAPAFQGGSTGTENTSVLLANKGVSKIYTHPFLLFVLLLLPLTIL